MNFFSLLMSLGAAFASAQPCDDAVEKLVAQKPPPFAKVMRKPEPRDLPIAGQVAHFDNPAEISALAKQIEERDGVYVYVVDEAKLGVSHRAPQLTGIDPERNPYLGNHLAVSANMDKQGSTPKLAAGEVRVVDGQIVRINTQSGALHDDFMLFIEAQLPGLDQASQIKAKELISELKGILDIPKLTDRESALSKIIKSDPVKNQIYGKAKQSFEARGNARLEVAEQALAKTGRLAPNVSKKVFNPFEGDAHSAAAESAKFEINCTKDPDCRRLLEALNQANRLLVRRFGQEKVADVLHAKGFEHMATGGELGPYFLETSSFANIAKMEGVSDALHSKYLVGSVEPVRQMVERLPEILKDLGVHP